MNDAMLRPLRVIIDACGVPELEQIELMVISRRIALGVAAGPSTLTAVGHGGYPITPVPSRPKFGGAKRVWLRGVKKLEDKSIKTGGYAIDGGWLNDGDDIKAKGYDYAITCDKSSGKPVYALIKASSGSGSASVHGFTLPGARVMVVSEVWADIYDTWKTDTW